MYLSEGSSSPKYKFHKPGAISHARFMAKALYYMKFQLLLPEIKEVMNINSDLEHEIRRMADFISIFYAPWFLTCEFPDTAAFKVRTSSD